MSDDIDRRVLDAIHTARQPLCARDIHAAEDTLGRKQVSHALYRLRVAGHIAVVGDTKHAGKGARTVPLYEAVPPATTAPKCQVCGETLGYYDGDDLCAGCNSELDAGGELTRLPGDDGNPIDEPPVPAKSYEDEAPQATQHREYAEANAETARVGAATGDPICGAIDRLPLGGIQGAQDDARVLRHLAARLSDIGPDVAARLVLIASKLEGHANG